MEKGGRAGKYGTERTGKGNKEPLLLCAVSIESHRNY